MTDLVPTRAQQIGVKPRVLAARTKRSLKSPKKRLIELAVPWDEIDNSIEFELDQTLLPAFEAFEAKVDEAVQWLEEPADY